MPVLDPAAILGPSGAIARRLSNYEHRTQQLEMANAVAAAIEKPGHLIVEAGTGVGKSFAYLVPAIQAAVELEKKVVVSTHTIALQEQLLNKDVPFLRSVLPYEFTAILVKGRSNYLSLRRLDSATKRQDSLFQTSEEVDQLAELRFWAGSTQDGSRSNLRFRPKSTVWDAVVSDSGNCLGRECPRHPDCFFFKDRRRMRNAQILVVNHALLVADLALRDVEAQLLPDYDVAIIDEAHTLEAVAAEHLGLRLTSGSVDFTLNRLYHERTHKGLLSYHKLEEAIHRARAARAAAESFFNAVANWRANHPAGFNGRVRKPIALPGALVMELRALSGSIAVATQEIENREDRLELAAADDRCRKLADQITAWVNQDDDSLVYWVENTGTQFRRIELAAAPEDPGPALRRLLFEETSTCVLTSATLCVGSPPSFEFIKSRVGLTAADTIALGSPFDYAKSVAIHIPRNLPDPTSDAAAFERESVRAIAHYLDKTHGKAFVLFTSYKMLDASARAITPFLARRNIALFTQSDGMPLSKMVEAFKADVDSVIFGADSFWQGIDVPGEALSNVIITKLPFSVPSHPLLEARLEAIRARGGNPFIEYQVPEAVIKLKQGFGRLIRAHNDSGIVVILDPRVLTKPYGRTFLSSLPPCPRVIEAPDFGSAGL